MWRLPTWRVPTTGIARRRVPIRRRNPPAAATAEHHYRAALAGAKSLGLQPLVAHCHLGLGDVSRQANALADAREHLTAAMTMYRETAMPFWLAKAEAALAELR